MDNDHEAGAVSPARSGALVKIGIVVILAIALGAVLYLKNHQSHSPAPPPAAPITAAPVTPAPVVPAPVDAAPVAAPPVDTTPAHATSAAAAAHPRLVDLGATKCIPCKMMAPILEELKKTYAGKLDVVFIDVWEKPDAAQPFNIKMIPTQIFFDATGKERFRHEGFFAREDILAKWKELGVDLAAQPAAS